MKKFLIVAGTLGFLSAGISALSAFAPAHAQSVAKPTFRLCTAAKDGNYDRAANIVKKNVTSVKVETINTKGSIDNLGRLLRDECDGAFVQSDSMLVFSASNAQALSGIERAGVLYQEQVHLLCNRNAGVKRIVNLTSSHRVAIGPEGSGNNTTMAALKLADKKLYGPVQTDTKEGVRALSAVADGSEVQCMLYVAAVGAPLLKQDAANLGSQVVLVDTDDRDMTKNAKDSRGKAVYSYGTIENGTYTGIQPSGMIGTKAVDTVQVDALFVASTKWLEANPDAYASVLRGFNNSKPQIDVEILRKK